MSKYFTLAHNNNTSWGSGFTSDGWPHFIFVRNLRNPCGDFFHVAHTHPLGGVDVPFVGYDLLPTIYCRLVTASNYCLSSKISLKNQNLGCGL